MGASAFNSFIDLALAEDVGTGDHTTLATVPADMSGRGVITVKSDGIVAGIRLASSIISKYDPRLKMTIMLSDGAYVNNGDQVFTLEGNIRSILTLERLLLNCMQRMSGIASLTNRFVRKIQHTNVKLLDTRKTTPGFRAFEKEAVRIGGGYNHRAGLFDMMLIKDNHIDAAGGVEQAIRSAVKYKKQHMLDILIEVEVRDLNELKSAMGFREIDRVMLDNFSLKDTAEAVRMVDKRLPVESSGGINLQTISAYAETGVDFISVGALTHQFESLDMSLKISRL